MTPQIPSKNPKSSSQRADTRRYIKHGSPEGLRRGLNRMMNQILNCDDPLSHAGQYASLANSMTNSQKFSMEIGEWKKIQDRVDALEKEQQKG